MASRIDVKALETGKLYWRQGFEPDILVLALRQVCVPQYTVAMVQVD